MLVAALLACAAIVMVTVAGAGGATVAPAAEKPDLTSGKSPIQHVVILYLENQSFDSILGFWCDIHRTRCPVGGMPKSVTLSDGAVATPKANPDVVPQVNHSVISQLAAMNIQNGVPQMNGWENIVSGQCNKASHYRCVSGYLPRQEPNLAALADKFAISDNTFSLADSPSWGGHLYVVTGNLDGFPGNVPQSKHGIVAGAGWGCDSNKLTPWQPPGGGPVQEVPGCVPDPSLRYKGAPLPNGGAFEPTQVPFEPTIMDELKAAHLSWKFYAGTCVKEARKPNGLERCGKADGGYAWAICPTFAQCLYAQRDHLADPNSFLKAAQAGTLPSFSVITPSGRHVADSEHNGFSMTAGDDWVGQVASALMASPEWKSSALFITWDDCGCFYDQAVPGHNPDGTWQGPREPLVIVSPYAKPGYTDSVTTSFAGILAYVEHTFGLAPLGVNDAGAYAYAQAFNYAQRPLGPVPMVNRPVPRGDHIDWAQGAEGS
jgi:phospholipase C